MIPSPTASGLIDRDGEGGVKADTSGSRSSPWSRSSAGGALTTQPIDPHEDLTQTDLEVVSLEAPKQTYEESQPTIAQVGFSTPRGRPQPARPAQAPIPRRMIPEERAATEQIPVENLLRQARSQDGTSARVTDFKPFAGMDAETEPRPPTSPYPAKLGFSRIPSERSEETKAPRLPGAELPPFRAPVRLSPEAERTLEALEREAASRKNPRPPIPAPKATSAVAAFEPQPPTRAEGRARARAQVAMPVVASTELPTIAPVPPRSLPRTDDLLANRPVQNTPRELSAIELVDVPTPALPHGMVEPELPIPRTTSWAQKEPPPEDTRLAAPGELAGPAPPARPQPSTAHAPARPQPPAAHAPAPPHASETFAAPGELAGILASFPQGSARSAPAAQPRMPPVEAGPTIAAPGELAGLIRDLAAPPPQPKPAPNAWERRPTESPRPMMLDKEDRRSASPAHEPSHALPSHSDLLRPVALAQPLDTSLPARTKTEPEASLGSLERGAPRPASRPASLPATPPAARPKIAPDATKRLQKQTLDDGQLSMPGSALPLASDTLIPAIRPDQLRLLAEAEAEEARPAEAPAISLEVSGMFRRILAAVIDGVVLGSIVLVPMLFGVFGAQLASASYVDPDQVSALLTSGALKRPALVLAAVLFVSSALGHAIAGRSLGKLVMGLEVVARKTGKRPGPIRAILRACFSLLSLALMAAGYLWLFVDRSSRAFHDWLSGTVVVRSSSRKPHAAAD